MRIFKNDSKIGRIFIDGEIGTETTPKSVRDEIAMYPDAVEFEVHFNSEGGEVFDGYQIGSILKNIGKPTTAIISGLCASIATYAACCCDKLIMTPHGEFMIHDPTATAQGRAQDFRKVAEQLDRIKNEIIDRYMSKVSRKGVTREQLAALMDKEESMSPNEAFDIGFIDEVREKLKMVAKIDITKIDMKKDDGQGEGIKKFFDELDKKFNSFFKKFNNTVEIALADGSMATSDAATADALVDSKIVGPDGQPLADGTYETSDGYALVVAGGVVASYDPLTADKGNEGKDNKDVAALQQKVKDLEAQLAASKTAEKAATGALAKMQKEFKNTVKEFKNFKAELEEFKTKTFGDDDDDNKNPKFRNGDDDDDDDKPFDPMSELGDSFISSRPTLFQNAK